MNATRVQDATPIHSAGSCYNPMQFKKAPQELDTADRLNEEHPWTKHIWKAWDWETICPRF
jgi:hypothetical protein